MNKYRCCSPQLHQDGAAITGGAETLQGKPLTVFGDGSQTRSFCYVDDLIRAITALLLIKSDKTVAERTDRAEFLTKRTVAQSDSVHDPVNIGNPHELTVREIAKLILKLTGSGSRIEYQTLPADDPRVRGSDIRRAKALLDWEPEVKVEDGLLKTSEYFR